MKSSLFGLYIFYLVTFFYPFYSTAQESKAQDTSTQQTHLDTVETLTVTGSRIAGSKQGAFSVLRRAEIEQINPLSTIALLRRLPHVGITENGPGGLSYLSIRGGEANFTLIMIDGIVVNDSTNSRGGGFDFSQINPSAIESIEVYRGGISAIYGGEAISGLVHIKTRTGANKEVTLEIGNNDQVTASLTQGHRMSDTLSLLVNLSTAKRRHSSTAKSSSQQGLVKLNVDKETQNHQMLFTFTQADNTSFAEDSGGNLFADPNLPERRESEQWLWGVNSEFELAVNTQLQTKLSWLNRQEMSRHPGILDGVISGIPASEIQSDYDRKELELFVTTIINPQTTLVLGANLRKAIGENRGFLDFGFPLPVDYKLTQDTHSLFTEGQFSESNYSINIGWRLDNSDQFASETSWRLATNYLINEHTDLFAVYNQGYKLPSFFALAHPLVGNSELLPERSENVELGIRYTVAAIHFSATLFNHKFTDLVDFDADLFTNVNRNKVDTRGLELSTSKIILKCLTLSANISYTDFALDNGPNELRRRPKWSGSLALDIQKNSWSLGLYVDYSGKQFDSSIATSLVELGSYATAGLVGKWLYSNKLSFSLNIDNVFAKETQESVGFIDDNRLARLGLQYTFD